MVSEEAGLSVATSGSVTYCVAVSLNSSAIIL